MLKRLGTVLLVLSVIMSNRFVLADETTEAVKITGSVISDYYYIHEAEPDVASNYKPKMMRQVYDDGRSGFQFRRIYLTFDKKLDSDFSTRIRFEMSNTDYNYSKIEPVVKDAYLKWGFHANHQLLIGISNTPTFAVIEKFWGYRPLEKTADDYFEIRSSRDMGLALKGKINNRLNYHLFFGNGESNASEKSGTNDKLISLSISQKLANNFIYDLYSDYRLSKNGKNDEFTGQIFVGYQNEKFRIGAQYTKQQNKQMKSNKKGDINLYSIPFVFHYNHDFSFIMRYAFYDVKEEQNYQQQAILLGCEYKWRKNISLMPNITYNDYNFDNVNGLGKDLISRITLTYKFK